MCARRKCEKVPLCCHGSTVGDIRAKAVLNAVPRVWLDHVCQCGVHVLASHASVFAPKHPTLGFHTDLMCSVTMKLWLAELHHVCQCGLHVLASHASVLASEYTVLGFHTNYMGPITRIFRLA